MSRPRILARLCLSIIFLTACITLAISRGHPYKAEFSYLQSSVPDGSSVKVLARVSAKIRGREGVRIVLDVRELSCRHHSYRAGKLNIYSDKDYLNIGDLIETGGTLEYYDHARNPGNFDSHFYYGVRGIDGRVATGYVKIIQRAGIGLKEWMYRASVRASAALNQGMGDSEGSMMSSILLGNRAMMDQDLRTLYQKNGIAHILAISGLHLSLMGLGIYSLLKKAGLPYYLRFSLTVSLLTFYMILTGFSVSICRAMIMLVVKMISEKTGRCYDGLTALSVAVVFILFLSPWYLWDASFQLSVSAVCALYIAGSLDNKHGRLQEALRSSLGIFFISLPVTLWHFFEVSPYSVILNLVVIPLLPVAMISGLIGILASVVLPFGSAVWGMPAFTTAKVVLKIYEAGCHLTEFLPASRICAGRPPAVLIVFYYMALYLCCRLKEDCKRGGNLRYLIPCMIPVCSLCCILCFYPVKSLLTDRTEIVMLDIGQGDCLFIDDGRGARFLVDAGSSSIDNAGSARIEPFLLSRGIHRLDAVFISHGDMDHISAVFENMEHTRPSVRIKRLIITEEDYRDENLEYLNNAAGNADIPVSVMRSGQQITVNNIIMRCLGPPSGTDRGPRPEQGNEASMVLRLERGAFSMLFTGGIEGKGEEALVRSLGNDDCCTVLKVAHHGSKYSTSSELLEKTHPKAALISAGENNLYGHPHEKTLRLLQEYGALIYRTDISGAISVQTDGRSTVIGTPSR